MRSGLHRFGKFYSRVMLRFIGIFIFVGIMFVLFGEQGWFANENLYAISHFVYSCVLPVMIAYAAGEQMGDMTENGETGNLHAGGVLAVMAEAGVLVADEKIGFFGAMVLGPCCGILWKKVLFPLIRKINTQMEMLLRNLLIAGTGCLLAVLAFYVLNPLLSAVIQGCMAGIHYLVQNKLLILLSFIIEPAKVLFLNNSVHHGILLPLGMQQTAETGKSVLFLLETNPGPGLGLLTALFLYRKDRRKEYSASIFAMFIGGIHEIYFPEVLKNIWLLAALIAGGTVGNLCFLLTDAGAVTVISPGSIITFLLGCIHTGIGGAALGVCLSALTTGSLTCYILFMQDRRNMQKEVKEETKNVLDSSIIQQPENTTEVSMRRNIHKIGFVCDAGAGSSAMGAALLRRKLRELQIEDMEVAAYACDQIPEILDLIICQKNFRELLGSEPEGCEIYTVESLVSSEELTEIAGELKRRRDVEQ